MLEPLVSSYFIKTLKSSEFLLFRLLTQTEVKDLKLIVKVERIPYKWAHGDIYSLRLIGLFREYSQILREI